MPYAYQSIYFDDPIRAGRVVDVFEPDKITRDTAIFIIHGGGWSGGSRAGFHAIMRAFNAEGFLCASTDYRLTPSGATILDQIEDVRAGYKLFLQHLNDHKRPTKVFTHGSSAGAHLTALLSFAAPGECGEDDAFPDIQWIPPVGTALQATPVTFEPWEDMFPHIWTAMRTVVGADYDEHPELYRNVSPNRYLSEKTCPVFFMEAEHEHMFPLTMILETIERLRALGVRAEHKIYDKTEHGFFYDVTRRQQKEAFADIVAFIESLS